MLNSLLDTNFAADYDDAADADAASADADAVDTAADAVAIDAAETDDIMLWFLPFDLFNLICLYQCRPVPIGRFEVDFRSPLSTSRSRASKTRLYVGMWM